MSEAPELANASEDSVATLPTCTEDSSTCQTKELENLKKVSCHMGSTLEEKNDEVNEKSSVSSSPSRSKSDNVKVRRKSRSTRRRLNAMMNNSSLHFSDTDSEGELTLTNSTQSRNLSPNKRGMNLPIQNPSNPVISVTLTDGTSDTIAIDESCKTPDGERGNNFVENLTDVDEIYTSDPDNLEITDKTDRKSLIIVNNICQVETDLEDMSNDEAEDHFTIYVEPRSDLLAEFDETITTKEGDGPFSIEVRRRMNVTGENSKFPPNSNAPEIIVMPTTDIEDMDASDEDEDQDGACGLRDDYQGDFEISAASQIVMRNLNKMENSLSVKDVTDDAISDSHTDVEDVE